MDKLKATLEKTHQALEEEKHRTVDLLYSIFPGDVAQRLWQGLLVQAKKFDDVTMLFSDIVGFTAVCAQCTPMQVISMLNELYTRFDYQCGILDVYKVKRLVIDRYWFFRTDTDYLYVYVTDMQNRYMQRCLVILLWASDGWSHFSIILHFEGLFMDIVITKNK